MTAPGWTKRTMWTGDNVHVKRGMNAKPFMLVCLVPQPGRAARQ